MTHDLQAIRDGFKLGESKTLVSKGISFGKMPRLQWLMGFQTVTPA
jgi:hypothetical protein